MWVMPMWVRTEERKREDQLRQALDFVEAAGFGPGSVTGGGPSGAMPSADGTVLIVVSGAGEWSDMSDITTAIGKALTRVNQTREQEGLDPLYWALGSAPVEELFTTGLARPSAVDR